jgi:energy-converting hydrogenase A subunit R
LKKAFVSDCEGPISKNDNAFELTSHFVPNGDKLFTVISRYDDVLADVVKRAGYKAGDTLRLILPFLKAYGVTEQQMKKFSAQNLILIPSVKETLKYVQSIAPAYIVSTSYEHYIEAMCHAIDFPCEKTYCTKARIDKYNITEEEKRKLKVLAEEISQMSIIEIPFRAKSLDDFPEIYEKTIERLDEIFWKEIACTELGKIFKEVNPVGGKEKAEAVKDIVKRLDIDFSDVMYVGDSITDEEAFKLIKEKGGLAVSFNGNQYAIENSEIAIMSENSIVTAIIADIFIRLGKTETMSLVEGWSSETLKKGSVNSALLKRLFELFQRELPKVKIITSKNMEALAKESAEFRKKVRGEAIGGLG